MNPRTKKTYMWNTLSGIINAGQSAVILIFISYSLDTETAGIFTIAYALANLFSTIGKYGVRNYQVTDLKEKNDFSDYLFLRIVTVILAFVLMLIYVKIQFFKGSYDKTKALVVILVSIWKLIDSVEDVFYGMYQQNDRLDIAAKCYSLRLMFSTFFYCAIIIVGCNLIFSTLLTILVSIIIAVRMIYTTLDLFEVNVLRIRPKNIKTLFLRCLPLCIATSLSMYVGNMPKYLIDFYMDEMTQAYFGFLMMPAFVILVLGGFIYQPLVKNFAEMWENKNIKKMVQCMGIVFGSILFFSGVVVLIGRTIGLDILSFLYNVNLLPYKEEFTILLFGGGVYAMVSFLMVLLTSIRMQKNLAIGFSLIAIFSCLTGSWFVNMYAMKGVAILYFVQNIFLLFYFLACFIFKVRTFDIVKH